MTVQLPSNGIEDAVPFFIDMGGVMSATLGGDDQRLNRIGSRWGVQFRTKPMKGEDARIWISRLIKGVHEKARIRFPQPGVTSNIPAHASNLISGDHASNLSSITVQHPETGGAAAGALFKEGQFITLVKTATGKRYLHQITADAALVSGGAGAPLTATLPIQPRTRVALDGVSPGQDSYEIAPPQIEGYVKGDRQQWNVDKARIYGLEFVIEEAS